MIVPINMKYIYFRCGKWSVEVRGILLGRFITKEDAIKVRDEYVSKLRYKKSA